MTKHKRTCPTRTTQTLCTAIVGFFFAIPRCTMAALVRPSRDTRKRKEPSYLYAVLGKGRLRTQPEVDATWEVGRKLRRISAQASCNAKSGVRSLWQTNHLHSSMHIYDKMSAMKTNSQAHRVWGPAVCASKVGSRAHSAACSGRNEACSNLPSVSHALLQDARRQRGFASQAPPRPGFVPAAPKHRRAADVMAF